MKTKKYTSPPTCKQINSILNKGWKVSSINSILCLSGQSISVKKEDGYLFMIEKCNGNERFCCLQRFIYYTLWSKEEYIKAREEIEEYKNRGACIISTVIGERVALTRYKEVVPPLLSSLENSVDVLYYIILPKEMVTKQDEQKSVNEMLTYLGFKTYPNVLFGMVLFLVLLLNIFGMLWAKVSADFLFWLLFLIFCFCIKDCYLFFRYRLYRKEYSFRHFIRRMKRQGNINGG